MNICMPTSQQHAGLPAVCGSAIASTQAGPPPRLLTAFAMRRAAAISAVPSSTL